MGNGPVDDMPDTLLLQKIANDPNTGRDTGAGLTFYQQQINQPHGYFADGPGCLAIGRGIRYHRRADQRPAVRREGRGAGTSSVPARRTCEYSPARLRSTAAIISPAGPSSAQSTMSGIRRGLQVHLDHARSGLFRQRNQSGRRINLRRGAHHQQHLRLQGGMFGFLHHAFRQRLAKPDHAGTRQPAASAVRRQFGQGCAPVRPVTAAGQCSACARCRRAVSTSGRCRPCRAGRPRSA